MFINNNSHPFTCAYNSTHSEDRDGIIVRLFINVIVNKPAGRQTKEQVDYISTQIRNAVNTKLSTTALGSLGTTLFWIKPRNGEWGRKSKGLESNSTKWTCSESWKDVVHNSYFVYRGLRDRTVYVCNKWYWEFNKLTNLILSKKSEYPAKAIILQIYVHIALYTLH